MRIISDLPTGRNHRMGAVIAGGRSSRFGSDKALAMLDGRTLLEHAIATLTPWVERVVVCGHDVAGLTMLADLPEPGLGPLGGMAAALDHAERAGYAQVVTIACDTPRVPPALIDTLIARAPSYCAQSPLLGCWPSAWAGRLRDHLAAGGARAVGRWGDAAGAARVEAPSPVPNVNTPGDLAWL